MNPREVFRAISDALQALRNARSTQARQEAIQSLREACEMAEAYVKERG
jgi:hypothetical protein